MNLIIQTPTPSIAESIAFYTKCGFVTIFSSNHFTDGKSIIEINENRFARPGIKLLSASWKNVAEQLEAFTHVKKIEDGYLLGDGSGTWIYLIETSTFPEIPADCSPSLLGNNFGISIETIDIGFAQKIWNLLGFTTTQGSAEQGWISLSDDNGNSLSLMAPNCCPHLFLNPSISYFNGAQNPTIIEKIRSTGISITEEITHFNKEGKVDNIILSDPGNIGFFIFND